MFFIKNWLGIDFLDFRSIADNTLEFSTNNTAERFKYILNNCVKHYHPKLSYFIDKYKSLIISYYNKYINLLINKFKINYLIFKLRYKFYKKY